MTDKDFVPTYNLKAALRETGLKADTLRAWERRYGLPQPERSAGGHRLFSQRDIDTLKWLITRQAEGLSISRAVDLWRSIEAEGREPMQVMPIGSAVGQGALPIGAVVDDLRRAWIEACKDYDENRAELLLTQAFAQFPPEIVCLEILARGLSEIGEGWYRGEVSVQQEHLASSLAHRRIEALLTASAPPTYPGTILILCPPEDEHTFSPLVLTYLLRRRGRMAIFLGANVPLQDFEETLKTINPQLVVMTAQDIRAAATLLPFSEMLNAADVPFAYGGLAFNSIPDLQKHIPGHFLGETLSDAPNAVEGLLSKRPEYPEVAPLPPGYKRALYALIKRQSELVARLSANLTIEGTQPGDLANAHLHITRDIIAALQFGDLHLMAKNIAWIQGLIQHHGIPAEALGAYLDAYQQSIRQVAGDEAKVVVDFFDELKIG